MKFSFSKKAAKGLIVGGVAVMMASNAFAATQGTTGGTSTGNLLISLNVNDEVRISNLQDINLGVFDGQNGLSGTSDACVFRNGTGIYQITATGSGDNNEFQLASGENTVDYTVSYNSGIAGVPLLSGTAVPQTGGDPSSETCGTTGNNGVITVDVAAAELIGSASGGYQGTLTLTVAPQ